MSSGATPSRGQEEGRADVYGSRRVPRGATQRARGRMRGAGTSILDAPPPKTPRAIAAGGLGSLAFHLGLIGLAIQLATLHPKQPPRSAPVTQMIDVALQPPEPPAAPEPPPPPAAEPPPPPKAARAPKPSPAPPPPSAAAPPAKAQEPPPAAAETGKLLEAAEPVDFGDQFVAGNANQFAGGVSASGGTSKQAVQDSRAQAHGVPGGTGNGQADLSRAPQLADGLRWDIPFPVEADDAAVDHAKVTLRVSVAADGRVSNVAVLSDPGFGFGREARRFALTRRWTAGRDRAGNPIATSTTVNVRFDR